MPAFTPAGGAFSILGVRIVYSTDALESELLTFPHLSVSSEFGSSIQLGERGPELVQLPRFQYPRSSDRLFNRDFLAGFDLKDVFQYPRSSDRLFNTELLIRFAAWYFFQYPRSSDRLFNETVAAGYIVIESFSILGVRIVYSTIRSRPP